MKSTCALSRAAHERRRKLKFWTRYTQTIAVRPTLIHLSSNAKKSLWINELQMIMTCIPAVELNHARRRATFLDQVTAARGQMWNTSHTKNTVTARYNIFDRAKIASQFRIPFEVWV
jgi:hypothetical protein